MKSNPFRPHFRLARTIMVVVLGMTMMLGVSCTSGAPAPQIPDKNAPVIHFITAEKQVKPSSMTKIQCLSTGKEGDTFSYKWSATGGGIQGEGNGITWIAPRADGDYTITVVVSNDKGNQTTGWVNINVSAKAPQYPVVISMICGDCRGGVEASRWKQYTVLCEAEDPNGDELSYQWLATTGKISGDESIGRSALATWHTADQSGNALIKVIVTDKDGNQTEGYLSINISCCH